MSGRFRPVRKFRTEVFHLVLAAAVPLALFALFPCAALRPLPPSPRAASAASCAFVSLTPQEERAAIAAARTAWQLDRGTSRHPHIDVGVKELPPMPKRSVLVMSSLPPAGYARFRPYAADPLPPTLAAPPPARIAPQPDADAPTFSREELLKLN